MGKHFTVGVEGALKAVKPVHVLDGSPLFTQPGGGFGDEIACPVVAVVGSAGVGVVDACPLARPVVGHRGGVSLVVGHLCDLVDGVDRVDRRHRKSIR